jgi:hypothetical protein
VKLKTIIDLILKDSIKFEFIRLGMKLIPPRQAADLGDEGTRVFLMKLPPQEDQA